MKIVKTLIFLTLFIVGNSYFNQVFSQEINSTEENETIKIRLLPTSQDKH